jgi:ABC-type transport system involved in cytochrome c biogenesis permease subunit
MPSSYLTLIVLALCSNLFALIFYFRGRKVWYYEFFFVLASLLSFSLFVCNWVDVGEPPFGNMYHVKVVLSFSFYPLWKLLSFVTSDKKQCPTFIISALIFVVASYFVWSGEEWQRPPALQSPYFVPHVMAYMIGYALATVAFVSLFFEIFRTKSQRKLRRYIHLVLPALLLILGVMLEWSQKYIIVVGIVYFLFLCLSFVLTRSRFTLPEESEVGVASYPVLLLSIPFVTMGLVLGCLWAEDIWGSYWSWDNKETWSLITWVLYVVYFHCRHSNFFKKYTNVIHLLAYLALVITFLAVNLLPKMASAMHSYAN